LRRGAGDDLEVVTEIQSVVAPLAVFFRREVTALIRSGASRL
jgi:hypothetical protein